MAARGVPEAQVERMRREVMWVDRVSWDEAEPKLEEIQRIVLAKRRLTESPYYFAVAIAMTTACLCLPMTFHHDTAVWFNEHYVTMDTPPEKEIETWLEVGGWTWNWVE